MEKGLAEGSCWSLTFPYCLPTPETFPAAAAFPCSGDRRQQLPGVDKSSSNGEATGHYAVKDSSVDAVWVNRELCRVHTRVHLRVQVSLLYSHKQCFTVHTAIFTCAGYVWCMYSTHH